MCGGVYVCGVSVWWFVHACVYGEFVCMCLHVCVHVCGMCVCVCVSVMRACVVSVSVSPELKPSGILQTVSCSSDLLH